MPLPPRGTAPAVLAEALPRLVALPEPGAEAVCLRASVRAGWAFDPVGAEGTAALVARAIVAEVDAARPEGVPPLTLAVGAEDVALGLRCPVALADACADALARALGGPSFTVATVDAARADALASLASTDPALLADRALDAWVFDAHPYGHPAEGRAGVLPGIDANDLRRFHATHWVRPAAVIGVGGAGTTTLAHALVARASTLGATPTPDLPLFRALPAGGRVALALDDGGAEAHVRVGAAFEVGDDPVALRVAALALRRVADVDVDLVGLDGPPGEHRRRPMLRVRLAPGPIDGLTARLTATLSALEDGARGAWPDSLLERARDDLAASLEARATLPCARLDAAVDAVVTGAPDAARVLPGLVAEVTPARVRAALAAALRPDDVRVVAVGAGAALVEALRGVPGVTRVDARPVEGALR